MREFKFEMSLSVLNHLGRNLYRNFITILGEVISNAWDADAKNVKIYIDHKDKSMSIIDDGVGMTTDHFQQKFLRIGHTKRDEGNVSHVYGRPYIGRKGIGKLALLSCSEKLHIASKYRLEEPIGGSINNSDLDNKIAEGKEFGEYRLETLSNHAKELLSSYNQGTAMIFEQIKMNKINSLDHVKKSIALYFQFAIFDKNFNIYVNDEKITVKHIQDLVDKTQMIWSIGSLENELSRAIQDLDDEKLIFKKQIETKMEGIKGFIATVDAPSSLKVRGLESASATLDLFVNGRMREKDLLKHFPIKRIAEGYVYGQIHYDALDEGEDAFTSSREGVIASDPRFQEMIGEIQVIFRRIIDEWDTERVKNRKRGDPDGPALGKRERPAREMVQAILEEDYGLKVTRHNRSIVDTWASNGEIEAAYNAWSYATCFVAENLLRNFIKYKNFQHKLCSDKLDKYKADEQKYKNNAGIDYEIRQETESIFYAGMDELTKAIATKDEKSRNQGLIIHGRKFKPLRNVVAHTGALTQKAKQDLELNFTNIKERLIQNLDKLTNEDAPKIQKRPLG